MGRVSEKNRKAAICYFSSKFCVVMSGYWTEDTVSTFLSQMQTGVSHRYTD